MKASFIKNAYNRAPESVKRMFGSAMRNKLVGNPIFVKQYEELEKADGMDEERLDAMRLELLRKTCVHAYEHTKYYREIFTAKGFDPYTFKSFEEFADKVPILTKQMALDHIGDINANDIADDYPATTGGSSGTRLQVNNSWEAFYRENAFHYHFQSRLGYDYKKHKMLLLAGSESDKLCSSSPLYHMIRVSGRYLTLDTMKEAVEFINKNCPDYIEGIPSATYQFCKYLRQGAYALDCRIKGVFFRSENINPAQRAFIEETLHCPTAAFYGSTERIAWGEEIGSANGVPHYRFHKLYGYTEIDRADNETIISTGFINHKMPLIRYRTDDTARLVAPGVFAIEGHRTTALVGKNGENISVEYFAHLEDTFDKIEKYQLEQHTRGEMIVNIVPRHSLSDAETEEIRDLFSAKCAHKLDVRLNTVSDVLLTPRGKFKLLIHSIDE